MPGMKRTSTVISSSESEIEELGTLPKRALTVISSGESKAEELEALSKRASAVTSSGEEVEALPKRTRLGRNTFTVSPRVI
jgi:hypothetical protein